MDNRTAQLLAFGFLCLITICFVLAWFFWQRARHRELMLMIEKGIDPAEHTSKTGKTLRTVAIILIGAAIGTAINTIMSNLGLYGMHSDSGTLAVFGLSIGAALYYAARPDQTKEK